MKNPSSTLDLKIFGWLGFLAICAGVLLVPLVIGYLIVTSGSGSSLSQIPGLGEKGSVCGGEARLPCNAGLICTHESDSSVGMCEPAPEAATSTNPVVAQNGAITLGGLCAELGQICAPSFACVGSATTQECTQAATSSPRIVSAKIEGAQLNDGVYRLVAGTKAMVTVQAVDAKEVVSNFGTSDSVVTFTRGKAGVYTAEVTFSSSATEFNVIARGAGGAWSGLVMKVATVEAVR